MIEVIHADALTLPLEFFAEFDHYIADPPYSRHVHANATSTRAPERGGPVKRDFGFAHLSAEAREFTARGMAKVRRWAIVFSDFAKGSDEFGDDAEAAAQAGHFVLEGDCAWRFQGVHAGLEWVRLVPWVRWSQAQITADRPTSGAEAVLHFHAQHVGPRGGRKPIAKHWNGPGNLTHYAWTSLRGDDKHPTEKPLRGMLDLVCFFTDAGESVLDTFGGRGTTAQACRLLGRDCVCVEQLEHFADQARVRVTSSLDARDLAAAEKWAEDTVKQAEHEIANPSGHTSITRANARLSDVQRLIANLAAI